MKFILFFIFVLFYCIFIMESYALEIEKLDLKFHVIVERGTRVPGLKINWDGHALKFCNGGCFLQFPEDEINLSGIYDVRYRVKIIISRPINLPGTIKVKGPTFNDGGSWGKENKKDKATFIPGDREKRSLTSGQYVLERIIEGTERAAHGSFIVYRYVWSRNEKKASLSKCNSGKEIKDRSTLETSTSFLPFLFATSYCLGGSASDLLSLCIKYPDRDFDCKKKEDESPDHANLKFYVTQRGMYDAFAWFDNNSMSHIRFWGE